MGIERTIAGYYDGRPRQAAYLMADGTDEALRFAADWRAGRVACSRCRRTVGPTEVVSRHGGSVRCARCRPAPSRPSAARTTGASASSTLIAKVTGVAVSFARAGCEVCDGEHSHHERFMSDCFDASIARDIRRVKLDIDHDDIGLRGSFGRIWNDGGVLRFTFWLEDGGARERDALRAIQTGAVTGCSVAFSSERERYDRAVREYQQASLKAISLCRSRRAAWYGTTIGAERY
jgi:phage head maturation protease